MSLLRIKGLDLAIYNTNKYILILIYLPTTKLDGTKVLTRILREIYLVKDLKTYILLRNNVIESKKILIDIIKSKVYIRSYKVIATIIYY